jgi:Fic family protein
VNELRPLSPQVIELVQRDILGERVYSSNAIEGSTYSLGETIETLKTGYVAMGKKREATEAINLGKAIEHMQGNLLNSPNAYSEAAFLGVHQILLQGIYDNWAGRFRHQQVMIAGAKHQPPDHSYVPKMVDDFFKQLKDTEDRHTDTLVLATWAHWMITRIHPFVDGNGRMSRLWQDLVLFRGRLTCAIIPPEARNEYRVALGAADEGDFNLLTQLVARQVGSTLDKYLAAQQKIDTLGQWAAELVGETSARAEQKRRSAYLRWSRKMEELRYAFERCASMITHASAEIEIQFRAYPSIDQAVWENLRSGLGGSNLWFFKLVFRRRRQSLTYIFFFGKHFWSDIDNDTERAEPRVCLLISEQAGKELATRLSDGVDSPLTIRELFVVENTFVRVRFDALQNQNVFDRGVDPTVVAQEFMRDVLLLKMA